MKARGGEKHGREACGERKTGCARTSRGVGEAAMMEGISPGRATAETSPDRKCFFQREALTPEKNLLQNLAHTKIFSDLGPPPKFFRGGNDLGPPPNFFFQTNMQQKLFRTMSGKIGFLQTMCLEEGKGEQYFKS